MSVAIVKRYTTEEGVPMRELDCGHKVPEPQGGKARWALFVRRCIVCEEQAKAQIERDMKGGFDFSKLKLTLGLPICGKPATDVHGPGECGLSSGHIGPHTKLYLMPIPTTRAEFQRAGMVYAGMPIVKKPRAELLKEYPTEKARKTRKTSR